MITFFKLRGLGFIGFLAIISYVISHFPWVTKLGLSSLVIAIILGMIIGNIWQHPQSWNLGIQFAAKRLLRTAIILYGFRISFQEIIALGWQASFLDLFVVTSTLFIGYQLGQKIFKLDQELSLLIGAGAAICGAAAVLAVEDILKSDPYKTSTAIATVVLFGTISMFLYPLLQHLDLLGLTSQQFGIFAGASIHEVAQALVAGADINDDTSKIAVIVKMMRVLLLVPVLFFLVFNSQRLLKSVKTSKKSLTIPWFAIGFVLIIGFNSLHFFSNEIVLVINQIDIILLTMAMAAIGLETNLKKIKQLGLKPFYLAFAIFIWLLSSALLMVKILY